MRCIMFSVLILTGTAMTATEPQKKDEKKDPWTEKVSVRKYLLAGKMFVKEPQDNIDAYRGKIKDKAVIYLSTARLADFDAGSEITDKDGNVYKVDKKFTATGGNVGYGCFVSPVKPAEKKPE